MMVTGSTDPHFADWGVCDHFNLSEYYLSPDSPTADFCYKMPKIRWWPGFCHGTLQLPRTWSQVHSYFDELNTTVPPPESEMVVFSNREYGEWYRWRKNRLNDLKLRWYQKNWRQRHSANLDFDHDHSAVHDVHPDNLRYQVYRKKIGRSQSATVLHAGWFSSDVTVTSHATCPLSSIQK